MFTHQDLSGVAEDDYTSQEIAITSFPSTKKNSELTLKKVVKYCEEESRGVMLYHQWVVGRIRGKKPTGKAIVVEGKSKEAKWKEKKEQKKVQ